MGKTPTRRRLPEKQETAGFTITLKLGDRTYQSTGASALEALRTLQHPAKIVSKGFLTVTHGDKKREHFLMPARAKRLFYNPSAQAVIAKQLVQGMK